VVWDAGTGARMPVGGRLGVDPDAPVRIGSRTRVVPLPDVLRESLEVPHHPYLCSRIGKRRADTPGIPAHPVPMPMPAETGTRSSEAVMPRVAILGVYK